MGVLFWIFWRIMDYTNINIKFSENYNFFKAKKLSENPYLDKINRYSINDLIHLEDTIRESIKQKSSKILKEALDLCIQKKKELKSKVYEKYNKETNMEIDNKFEKHIKETIEAIVENSPLKSFLTILSESKVPETSLNEAKAAKEKYAYIRGKKIKVTKGLYNNKGRKPSDRIRAKGGGSGGSVLDAPEYNKRRNKGKGPDEKKYKTLDISQRRKQAKKNREKGITVKKSKERHKGMHFKGSNELAAVRFWNYRKANPKYRGDPQQTGASAKIKDGDIKGRFNRYYGVKGQKSRNKKPASAIRAAVARLISQGKWPSDNARKALAKGRQQRWKNKKTSTASK
jgi:hypothetical protein